MHLQGGPIFNAAEYNPILQELYEFIQHKEMVLAQQMQTNYANYAYFAFTALGCDVGYFKKIRDDEYEKLKRQRLGQPAPQQYVQLDDDSLPESVFERTGLGELSTYQCPIGPVLPKRVEEPLLWLFHKLGYIGVNTPIVDPARPKICCPECGSYETEALPPEEQTLTTGWGPFKKSRHVDHTCRTCGYCWELA